MIKKVKVVVAPGMNVVVNPMCYRINLASNKSEKSMTSLIYGFTKIHEFPSIEDSLSTHRINDNIFNYLPKIFGPLINKSVNVAFTCTELSVDTHNPIDNPFGFFCVNPLIGKPYVALVENNYVQVKRLAPEESLWFTLSNKKTVWVKRWPVAKDVVEFGFRIDDEITEHSKKSLINMGNPLEPPRTNSDGLIWEVGQIFEK